MGGSQDRNHLMSSDHSPTQCGASLSPGKFMDWSMLSSVLCVLVGTLCRGLGLISNKKQVLENSEQIYCMLLLLPRLPCGTQYLSGVYVVFFSKMISIFIFLLLST